MDDFDCHNMDSSVHRHQLRLLGLLVGVEGYFGNFTGSVELPCNSVGSRKSAGVVVWIGVNVYAVMVGHVCGCFYGIIWLWNSVAYHSSVPFIALFSGQYDLFYLFFFFFLTKDNF